MVAVLPAQTKNRHVPRSWQLRAQKAREDVGRVSEFPCELSEFCASLLQGFKASARSVCGCETRRGLTPPSCKATTGARAGFEPFQAAFAKLGEMPGKLGDFL